MHPQECPDIGPICAVRAEPPQQHDQQFYVGELRPIFEYSLSTHFGVELQLPFKVTHTTVQYRRPDGTIFVPDYEDIHHRNETLFGVGDPWLSARTAWVVGPVIIGGRVGLTLPVGKTEEDPFALGRAGLAHQHIQFGTGTFNPILGLEVRVPIGKYSLQAYGQAQVVLKESLQRFQAGNRYSAGLSGEGPIAGQFRASVGADVVNEQPERWFGSVEQDGNLGRTDVLVGGSLSYLLGGFSVSLGAKVPVYQAIITSGSHDGGQLTYPAIINLGIRRAFDLSVAP